MKIPRVQLTTGGQRYASGVWEEALVVRPGIAEVVASVLRLRMATSLLCMLVASWSGNRTYAEQATYKLLGREVGGYAASANLSVVIANKIGPRADMADWDEIKARYGGSEAGLKAFCEAIGLSPGGSAWVTRGGAPFWQEQRRYFLYRADHKPPADFMSHDQLQNNFVMLGSWYGSHPIVVKVTDFNSSDAAKWAEWDKILEEINSKDISGVYSLVTLDGKKMPATVSHGGSLLQVRSATFTINANGKCSSRVTFAPTGGAETTQETRASYVRNGPMLDMQWEGAGGTAGTIIGDAFTMENEGMIFAYKKSGHADQNRPLVQPVNQRSLAAPSRVDLKPSPPMAGSSTTVTYRAAGGPLSGAGQVTLHYGFNGWKEVTDRPMTSLGDEGWELKMNLPVSSQEFDFVFTDGTRWDNNSGEDWRLPVRSEGVARH